MLFVLIWFAPPRAQRQKAEVSQNHGSASPSDHGVIRVAQLTVWVY